ncbi:MAG: hypothetical protein SPG48_12585 [Treponema sp.]|nr:hypothetical protein [Treponema sp.]
MKKVSKLTALLAAGLLALGTFSFVSCSNGSGESSDTNNTPVTKEVTTTTTTITISGKDYTYTTVDGTSQNSDGVTISDDGTITITADDGSKLTIKGTSITYTTSDGKIYSGTSSDSSDSESIVLKGDAGEPITATSKSETKTETVSSDSAGSGTVRELYFTDLEGKIFNYKNDRGEDRWCKFDGGKVYKSSDKTYWNDDTSGWEEKGKSVALLNGTQYSVVGGKLPRTSGSGLYATFSGTFTEAGKSVTLSVTLKNNGTCTMTDSGATMSGTFTNNNGLLTMTIDGEAMYGFYDGSSIYMVDDLLTEVTSGSAGSSSGSSSGSTSEISVSGNTYVAYTLSDSKAQIHSISFSSDSVELVRLTSKDSKDNEFDTETCSYTFSGSDLLVGGEKLAVINSNGTITDTEGRSYTKYSGDVYAKTDYNSSKSKTVVEIVNLGPDEKGSFVEKIHKNGADSDGDSFDFTYTKSGSSVTITVSSLSASGTISTGTQTGVSVEKLSVTWEEDDVGEYIKLN